jgi:osmotically-inducible protein OsmY
MSDIHSQLGSLPSTLVERALGQPMIQVSRFGARYRRLGLVLVLATPLLGGCAAMVLGGAAVGVAAAHDRRTYGALMEDQEIEVRAMSALADNQEIRGQANISVTSYNRKVLMVGQANSEAIKEQALEIVSRLPKVERVIDEVTVGPGIDLQRQAQDPYLTTRAKLALTNINMPGFDVTRVKVITEDGVVYLMGLVTQEEGDAAAEKVRFVPGVVRVVKLFEYVEPKA